MISVNEFDQWAHQQLPFADYPDDRSLNGLQVGDWSSSVNHIAFALDASEASIRQASSLGAQMLFVHHGLFWGQPLAITASHYRRVSLLAKHNIALYAVHLPLDAADQFGNNYAVTKRCGFNSIKPFAKIGFGGQFEQEKDIFELSKAIFGPQKVTIWPFNNHINSAAIVVGGASRMVSQVKEAGYDCFITGEISHEIYHYCLEEEIGLIAGGHYQSEFIGLQAFAQHVSNHFKHLKYSIIDLPTGC